MASQSTRLVKALNLIEIVNELERDDEDTLLPNQITIFPPENANADVTDEDSGDEEFVTLQNLSGSQLRAPAEVTFSQSEDDVQPLSCLRKRRRTIDTIGEDSEVPVPSTFVSSTPGASTISGFVQPIVPRNQTYKWRNRHTPTPRSSRIISI